MILRGTMRADCKPDAAGVLQCPEPRQTILVLDYVDGSLLGWSTLTPVPAQPPAALAR